MKPVIGILSNYSEDDDIGIKRGIGAVGQEWQVIADDYIKSVEMAGGCPVVIPIVKEINSVEKILKFLDGIIFTGGSDINPALYGESPSYELGTICTLRDEHELELAKKVLFQMNIPVLGICRGIQLLNIATGGTLYQDIKTQKQDAFCHSLTNYPKYYPTHKVELISSSKLYKIFRNETLNVNSLHHQAIKDIGANWEISMISSDGIIEGIEMSGERFVAAVQWHPEMMAEHSSEAIKIFQEFILECKKSSIQK